MLTPAFRVSFPKVFQPADNGKFGLVMLFPKESTDMRLLEAAITTLGKEKYPKGLPKGFFPAIHDGDDSEREEQKGQWVINGKCGKYRPGIVDQNKQDILDEADFYPGCWARAVITLFDWVYPKMGTKGISVNVRNIQKIRDDEPLISRVSAADEFDAVSTDDSNDL
jgi:hypothetical protein